MARFSDLVLIVYAGIAGADRLAADVRTPTGFIPGSGSRITRWLPTNCLPGASLARTDAVVQRRAQDIMLGIDGIAATPTFVGMVRRDLHQCPQCRMSPSSRSSPSPTRQRHKRHGPRTRSSPRCAGELAVIDEAFVIVIPPPAVSGTGQWRRLQDDGAGPRLASAAMRCSAR